MIVKKFGRMEEEWTHNPIVSGIVHRVLTLDKVYEVPIPYIIEALVKGKRSPHHAFMQTIDEVRRLFEEFAKFIEEYEDTENVPDRWEQVVNRYPLNAPQFATMLFYRSRWINKPPKKVDRALKVMYEELTIAKNELL